MKKNTCVFIILILLSQIRVSAQGIKNDIGQADQVETSSSMPFMIKGKQTKAFDFKELKKRILFNSNKPDKVTLELATDPIWFAIRALPYIIEDQNGSTISYLNSFFANSVALYLLNKEIGLDTLMNKWEKETGYSDESKMHQRIGQMFDTVVINQRMSDEITKLEQSQLSDGSWPWFPGMKSNRYITQLICCGIGRLFDLHVYDNYSDRLNNMGIPAFKYCDDQMTQEYDKILADKGDLKEDHLSSDILTYLYARTFWNVPVDYKCGKALFYWQQQAWTYWQNRSPLEQAMLVPIFFRQGEDTVYIKTLQRFDKEAVHSDKEGVYWKWNTGNNSEKIATQGMILEGYGIMRYPTPDPDYIAGIKLWLLQFRQNNHWGTGAATINAVYALLQKDNNPVLADKLPRINIGDTHFDSTSGKGSGYEYHAWTGDEIKPKLADIKTENITDERAWGDISMDFAQKTGNTKTTIDGLKITKNVFFFENDTKTAQWMPLLKKENLKTGDSIKINIEIIANRHLNYIHIHNSFSPLTRLFDTTSGVKQIDGLSYERIARDGSIDFFLEHLDIQKYVLTYTLSVKGAGDFQKGDVVVDKVY